MVAALTSRRCATLDAITIRLKGACVNRNRLVVLGAAVLFVGCLAYAVLSLTGALQLLAPTYTNADFGIEPYVSPHDTDGDGIDDQTDILASARAYVETRPAYGSAYYEGGWPDDGRGVCTDVVAYALLGAGFDLPKLVDDDVRLDPVLYEIDVPDANIDYRRVENLQIYFSRNATSLTLDPRDLAAWQGGDIVVFVGHIGIVSDRRNEQGIALVIHHERIFQLAYEEDVLASRTIIGHYRMG